MNKKEWHDLYFNVVSGRLHKPKEILQELYLKAKMEVFDDIKSIGQHSCGFIDSSDNLCGRIPLEEIEELKKKHLHKREQVRR